MGHEWGNRWRPTSSKKRLCEHVSNSRAQLVQPTWAMSFPFRVGVKLHPATVHFHDTSNSALHVCRNIVRVDNNEVTRGHPRTRLGVQLVSKKYCTIPQAKSSAGISVHCSCNLPPCLHLVSIGIFENARQLNLKADVFLRHILGSAGSIRRGASKCSSLPTTWFFVATIAAMTSEIPMTKSRNDISIASVLWQQLIYRRGSMSRRWQTIRLRVHNDSD